MLRIQDSCADYQDAMTSQRNPVLKKENHHHDGEDDVDDGDDDDAGDDDFGRTC